MALTNNGLNESLCQSYLLRIWRESEDGEWRATLLTIPTQERHQFTSVEGLFNFLEFRTSTPVTKTPAIISISGFTPSDEVTEHQP